jgi:hypothetical protein
LGRSPPSGWGDLGRKLGERPPKPLPPLVFLTRKISGGAEGIRTSDIQFVR